MAQRGIRIPTAIRERMEQLAAADYGPTEIERTLVDEFGDAAPRLRTIQGVVSEARKRRGEPWSMFDSDPADLALILPVIRAGIEWTEGRRRAITQAQADLIVRIVRAAPDIPLDEAYRLSLPVDRAPGVLEMYLAYAPWRDACEAYIAAWRKGWIRTFSYSRFVPADFDPTEDGGPAAPAAAPRATFVSTSRDGSES